MYEILIFTETLSPDMILLIQEIVKYSEKNLLKKTPACHGIETAV